jgi:hypothetical protein
MARFIGELSDGEIGPSEDAGELREDSLELCRAIREGSLAVVIAEVRTLGFEAGESRGRAGGPVAEGETTNSRGERIGERGCAVDKDESFNKVG